VFFEVTADRLQYDLRQLGVSGLAIYGFFISLAKQKIFQRPLLEEREGK